MKPIAEDIDDRIQRFKVSSEEWKSRAHSSSFAAQQVEENIRMLEILELAKRGAQARPIDAPIAVSVREMSGDGTGPWRLFIGGFGIADWPCGHRPKEYADEVALLVARALKANGLVIAGGKGGA